MCIQTSRYKYGIKTGALLDFSAAFSQFSPLVFHPRREGTQWLFKGFIGKLTYET